ncbi:uncharacterized protein A1O9_09237 [Exophiala aquamarina CBS 119918]|uniref:Dolichol-phosphate mannosyltransferase n=1 Tax=Exophiala aquamarina CBS 119918 TaxID=1182545 RepID=A0A072PH13_9EURO|nr:uncharacterized protein A1O9_09237 [Exophiala aquamarina CBS 119918]KEF54795.1 hypothetical protein A1O9_09237 [Exophiala aquamarina CBS 119918]
MDVRLHTYYPRRTLNLSEYIPRLNLTQSRQEQHQPPNVLLFIGGMYDNFRSPKYPDDLAALFPRDEPNQKWSVFHVQLSSAGKCFGLVDLNRDVEEVGEAISHIRTTITKSPTTPVVIMGHSTGCQDSMHYMCSEFSTPKPPSSSSSSSSSSSPSSLPTTPSRPQISGLILQAPVSDREAMLDSINSKPAVAAAYKEALEFCASTPKAVQSKALLPWNLSYPLMGSIPTTVARFLSLASPDSPASPGADDYFSSDLSDATFRSTFGKLAACAHVVPSSKETTRTPKSMLVLVSGSDEHVSKRIDKEALMARWKDAISSGGSQSTQSDPQAAVLSPHSLIIKNALHDISGASVEARTARLVDMRGAVLLYLNDVVGDLDDGGSGASESSPWAIWRRDKAAIDAERGVQGVKL